MYRPKRKDDLGVKTIYFLRHPTATFTIGEGGFFKNEREFKDGMRLMNSPRRAISAEAVNRAFDSTCGDLGRLFR